MSPAEKVSFHGGMHEQISTRRLRVMKYRGSPHGTNEYPFIIRESGLSVLPITSLQLDHKASSYQQPLAGPGRVRSQAHHHATY